MLHFYLKNINGYKLGGITIEIYIKNKVPIKFYSINNQCYCIFSTCQNKETGKIAYDIMT
jgi:hypothetical protein